jgi:hypothetical protein
MNLTLRLARTLFGCNAFLTKEEQLLIKINANHKMVSAMKWKSFYYFFSVEAIVWNVIDDNKNCFANQLVVQMYNKVYHSYR